MKFRLTIDIDELNYAQAIRAILPFVKKEDIPLPEMVLSAAESPGVLENFLKFIPREKQDELILKTFDKKQGEDNRQGSQDCRKIRRGYENIGRFP